MGQVNSANADALIFDVKQDMFLFAFENELDDTLGFRILDGIEYKIT